MARWGQCRIINVIFRTEIQFMCQHVHFHSQLTAQHLLWFWTMLKLADNHLFKAFWGNNAAFSRIWRITNVQVYVKPLTEQCPSWSQQLGHMSGTAQSLLNQLRWLLDQPSSFCTFEQQMSEGCCFALWPLLPFKPPSPNLLGVAFWVILSCFCGGGTLKRHKSKWNQWNARFITLQLSWNAASLHKLWLGWRN